LKKILILIIIVLSLITYCNIAINNQIIEESKKELTRKNQRIAELEQVKYDQAPDNIFNYILAQNPDMSTRELADFVSYTYQLAEEFELDPYKMLAACEIENSFKLNRPGGLGEQGPLQLMPDTWDKLYKRFGFGESDFTNWYCNYKVSAYHLKGLLVANNGDWNKAIGQFNGGGRWQKKQQSLFHVKKFQMASRGTLRYRKQVEKIKLLRDFLLDRLDLCITIVSMWLTAQFFYKTLEMSLGWSWAIAVWVAAMGWVTYQILTAEVRHDATTQDDHEAGGGGNERD
jgi:hypothetical protein